MKAGCRCEAALEHAARLSPAARRAGRVLGDPDRPHRRRQAVEDVQLAAGILAEAQDRADRLQRGEAAGDARHRAEHALLGAGVAILGVERVADEAAIAGPVRLPAAERADLRLEAARPRPRRAGFARRCRNRRRRGASRNCRCRRPPDRRRAAGRRHSPRTSRASTPSNATSSLSRATRSRAASILLPADIVGGEQGLPLEIVERDAVVVDHAQPADSRRGEILNDRRSRCRRRRPRRADAASSRFWPSPPISLKDDMPRIAIELPVAQGHGSSRLSARSSRSRRCRARSHRALSTSTKRGALDRRPGRAARSARRATISKGSPPRLARITFTSPR